MKKTEFDTTLMEAEISAGIDVFLAKHGMTTDYQLQKAAGLPDNTLASIRKSGSAKAKTFYKIGRAVGYGGKYYSVINRVFKDFEGK